MKFTTILCLASTLAAGSALAADPIPVTTEAAAFTKQYQTYDEALRQKYLKTVETNKDFASFQARLAPNLAWLKSRGIGYYDPFTNSPEVTDKGAQTEYLDKAE